MVWSKYQLIMWISNSFFSFSLINRIIASSKYVNTCCRGYFWSDIHVRKAKILDNHCNFMLLVKILWTQLFHVNHWNHFDSQFQLIQAWLESKNLSFHSVSNIILCVFVSYLILIISWYLLQTIDTIRSHVVVDDRKRNLGYNYLYIPYQTISFQLYH